jgi:hypothetical protein
MSRVKYELGFYIPENDILRSHCHETLKSYITKVTCFLFPCICPYLIVMCAALLFSSHKGLIYYYSYNFSS